MDKKHLPDSDYYSDDLEIMRSMFSGTIHNIGNILAMASFAVLELEETAGSDSTQVLDVILNDMLPTLHEKVENGDAQHFLGEDEQGSAYLDSIRELLAYQRQVMESQRATINALGEKVNHISDIISLQQQLLVGIGTVENMTIKKPMHDALRMMRGSISRHGITLKENYGETKLFHGDPSTLTQVVINLIKNAIEAHDADGEHDGKEIHIESGIETLDDGERVIFCRIRDNGPGIPEDLLERIFDFGYTTKRRTSGERGVGLHFCRRTVEHHNGTLSVDSQLGQGSTFTIRLAFDDEEQDG